MSPPSAATPAPHQQLPKLLNSPLEVLAILKPLLAAKATLVLHFKGHQNAGYQTTLLQINPEYQLMAIDELVPNTGSRFLQKEITFRIECFHDGVKTSWVNTDPVQTGELDGHPCYWISIPDEVLHHQRRTAYRVSVTGHQIGAQLSDKKEQLVLEGELVDISATGCKLKTSGNLEHNLQAGVVYESLTTTLPFGSITIPVELRYAKYDTQKDATFCGFQFHRIEGMLQRDLSRFITQLQRELRRKT